MHSTASYRPPRRWLRLGNYLLPSGINTAGLRRAHPPRQQVPVAQLAADHPESVVLHVAGKAEALGEFEFECHASGRRERRKLPASLVAPAYVAEIRDGMSYGRHCCAIGPEGKAVRETGFHLDGNVQAAKVPINPLGLRYWRRRWEGDVTSRLWLPPLQRIDGSVALLNARLSHNYYHWLIDILPRLMALRYAGVAADYYLVDCLSPFQQRVLADLGIAPRQLIQPHCRLLLQAERLLVPSMPTPACLRAFGTTILAGLGSEEPVARERRIFISRRQTGTRTLANEAELEALLERHGFETHSMEQYPLGKQARLIHESQTIVATHGAGLANLAFAKPGTQVVEIVPEGRFNATCYPKLSRVFGLRHQLIFAQRARYKQILNVSLDDVAAALSQAERSESRSTAA